MYHTKMCGAPLESR